MEDYSTYTRMTTVPAGIILDRIIHQQKKSKVDVASSAHMIPQRLNDLINGNRRFTPKNSMALEQSLGIDIAGFFYIIQAHHDIYTEQKNESSNNRPDLTRLTKTTFWDVDLGKD
jgi:plasmid maintenance system antidote protein VapI